MNHEIVYIYSEGCLGYIVQRNAHFSIIKYAKDGIDYEVRLLNDEYDIRTEREDIEPDVAE